MKTIIYQNFGDSMKKYLIKSIALSAYIKKIERFQISKVMLHLNAFGKKEQTNLKFNRRQEIKTDQSQN